MHPDKYDRRETLEWSERQAKEASRAALLSLKKSYLPVAGAVACAGILAAAFIAHRDTVAVRAVCLGTDFGLCFITYRCLQKALRQIDIAGAKQETAENLKRNLPPDPAGPEPL